MSELQEGSVTKEAVVDEETTSSLTEASQPATPVVVEDSGSLAKEIRALRQQIADITEGQDRITHMQSIYKDIPDEALTEADAEIKKVSVEELKARLAELEEKKKANAPTGLRGLVKKINTFLSF